MGIFVMLYKHDITRGTVGDVLVRTAYSDFTELGYWRVCVLQEFGPVSQGCSPPLTADSTDESPLLKGFLEEE